MRDPLFKQGGLGLTSSGGLMPNPSRNKCRYIYISLRLFVLFPSWVHISPGFISMCDIESRGFPSLIPSVCSTDTSLLPPLLPFVQLIIYKFLVTWINTELFSCTVPRLVHEISDEYLCSPCLYCCNCSVPDVLLSTLVFSSFPLQ